MLSMLGLAALAGCKGSADNYYRVEIYSDYEGMEADYASTGVYTHEGRSSIKVGYCYALPGKEAKVGGIQVYSYDGKTYDYRTSTRDTGSGYEYVFKQLVGFYDNDPTKPIDLKNITANCEVFATFDIQPSKYVVSVKDAFGENLYQKSLEFGATGATTPELAEVLTAFPAYDRKADPEDPTTWRAPYYKDYAPKHWSVTEVNADKSTNVYTIPFDEASVKAWTVTKKTTFEPVYEESMKHFTLNVQGYQTRVRPAIGPDYYMDQDWADMPSVLDVEYGTDLTTLPELQKEGYTLIAEGAYGERSRFPSSASLPLDLKERTTGDPLPFDLHYARYNCDITLVYEANPKTYTVTFAGTTGVDPVEVKSGEKVTAPAKSAVVVPAGKVFSGYWAAEGYEAPYDLNAIYETVTLNPILLDEEIAYQADPSKPALTYGYDETYEGYVLIDVVSAVECALTADVFKPADEFPTYFPYIGVRSFGTDKAKVTAYVAPEGTDVIYHGCLTKLDIVESIDLRNATIETLPAHSFQNLTRLNDVKLPGSLNTVLGELFNNCTSLSGVYLDMTEAAYEALSFPTGWNSGLPVSFKA